MMNRNAALGMMIQVKRTRNLVTSSREGLKKTLLREGLIVGGILVVISSAVWWYEKERRKVPDLVHGLVSESEHLRKEGMLYASTNKLKKAHNIVETAKFDEASRFHVAYRVGASLEEDNKPEEAIEWYEKAAKSLNDIPLEKIMQIPKLQREGGICLDRIGNHHHDHRKYAQAEQNYRRALEVMSFPDEISAAFNLFQIQQGGIMTGQVTTQQKNDWNEKTMYLIKRGVVSEVAGVLNNLARLYEESGRPEDGNAILLRSKAVMNLLDSNHPEQGIGKGHA